MFLFPKHHVFLLCYIIKYYVRSFYARLFWFFIWIIFLFVVLVSIWNDTIFFSILILYYMLKKKKSYFGNFLWCSNETVLV